MGGQQSSTSSSEKKKTSKRLSDCDEKGKCSTDSHAHHGDNRVDATKKVNEKNSNTLTKKQQFPSQGDKSDKYDTRSTHSQGNSRVSKPSISTTTAGSVKRDNEKYTESRIDQGPKRSPLNSNFTQRACQETEIDPAVKSESKKEISCDNAYPMPLATKQLDKKEHAERDPVAQDSQKESHTWDLQKTTAERNTQLDTTTGDPKVASSLVSNLGQCGNHMTKKECESLSLTSQAHCGPVKDGYSAGVDGSKTCSIPNAEPTNAAHLWKNLTLSVAAPPISTVSESRSICQNKANLSAVPKVSSNTTCNLNSTKSPPVQDTPGALKISDKKICATAPSVSCKTGDGKANTSVTAKPSELHPMRVVQVESMSIAQAVRLNHSIGNVTNNREEVRASQANRVSSTPSTSTPNQPIHRPNRYSVNAHTNKPYIPTCVQLDRAAEKERRRCHARRDNLEANSTAYDHFKRLQALDYSFLLLSHEKMAVYWILGRFLANEEIASRIINKYRQYCINDGDTYFDHPQKMISFFLTRAFDNLPNSAVALLLSEDHRSFKGLKYPTELKMSDSLQDYVKKHKTYEEIVKIFECAKAKILSRRSQPNTEPNKEEQLKEDKNKKSANKNLDVTIVKRDSQLSNSFVFDSRSDVNTIEAKSKTTNKSFILCGSLIRYSDEKALMFRADSVSEESEILKSHGDQIKQEKLTSFETENGYRVFSMLLKTMKSKESDRGYRFKTLPLFAWQSQISAPNAATNLDQVLRNKPIGCSAKDLISWPWKADCEREMRRVRCLVRMNTTIKNLDDICDINYQYDWNKKPKGKRGKKAKWKHVDNKKSHQDSKQNDAESCSHPACQIFHDDFMNENLTVASKSVVVFPIYLPEKKMMLFLSCGKYTKQEEGKVPPLKIHDILASVLRCNCPLNLEERETDSTKIAWRSLSSREKHHHDDMVVDFILPMHIDESTKYIMTDVMFILRLLSQYIIDVHKQCFSTIDSGVTRENVENHVKYVILLCENVFSFLLFSEVWGPAEEHMRGSNYLMTANQHYVTSRDSALAVGIFPGFSKFISESVYKLPSSLHFVRNSTMYSVALSFLDHQLPSSSSTNSNANLAAGDTLKNFAVEPISVAMLETVLGKGYFNNVDDDLAYKLITNPTENDKNAESPHYALLSPVPDSKCGVESRLRLFGGNDIRFTNKGQTSMLPTNTEEKMEEIFKEIAKSFEQCSGDSEASNIKKINNTTCSPQEETALEIMRGIFESLQIDLQQRKLSNSVNKTGNEESFTGDDSGILSGDVRKNQDKPQSEAGDAPKNCEKMPRQLGSPQTNSNQNKEHDGDNISTKSQSEATEESNENSETTKGKGKKGNREYLSTAKRQQRQAKRLREKWEKKHKAEPESTEGQTAE